MPLPVSGPRASVVIVLVNLEDELSEFLRTRRA